MDLDRVPLHEPALQGEVPDGINVVRVDDRQDDVIRTEDTRISDQRCVGGGEFFSAYDEGMKQIPCVCGYAVKGENDDELWQNAQEHLREDHPELVGKVSRADLLAQAEEVSRPMS